MDGALWRLRKADGSIYGPASWPEVSAWARAGRVGPDDFVCRGEESWREAPSVPELGLRWLVMAGPDGSFFGPIHLLACVELISDGVLSADAVIRRVDRDDPMPLREALSRACPTDGGDLPPAPVPAPAVSGPAPPPSWQAMARDRDRMEKEVEHWKGLYEQERASARAAEDRLGVKIREMEAEGIERQTALERARVELQRLRRIVELPRAGRDGDILKAHEDLSRSFDNLSRQLADRLEELRACRAQMEALQRDASERIDRLEGDIRREREETVAARRRLAEMEETQLDIVRSFRDMNDRYIRLRERTREDGAET